jgi:pilus assembly protein TadC
MIHFLLAFCAVGIGWFTRSFVLMILRRFSNYKQNIRLKNIVEQSQKTRTLQMILSPLEKGLECFFKFKVIKKYSDYISRQLQRMNHTDLKPSSILSYQIILSFVNFLIFYFLLDNLFFSFIASVIGVFLPIFWLRDKALRREKNLLCELPNALEILSLCSEAGLSLEQGIDQYLKNSNPGVLKEEFAIILEQTRTGSSRKNALRASSSRLDLTDFSLFATSLIQAERFGTGVAKTLRQLSLTIRDKQSQRAEKAVQEMPVKMLLPLVLCIMPVTLLIIFGPVLLQFFSH